MRVPIQESRPLLIVDDEPLLLRALARQLDRTHAVTTSASPDHALKLLAAGANCLAVLCDLHMPGMTGVEFARRALASRPELAGRLLLMTGGAYLASIRKSLDESALPVIAKPIDLVQLRAWLARLGADLETNSCQHRNGVPTDQSAMGW